MALIKGMTVVLIKKEKTGADPFGAPVVEEKEITVDNVIIAPTLGDDLVNNLNLYGKKAVYTLGIPKGDTNVWEDQEVRFFGQRWRVFGKVTQGMEHMIPLEWNKKVLVESYE